MNIGELARKTGVSTRMLRYYEERGLLSPVRRASGYRDYSLQDLEVVQRIIALNRAGLTLKDVKPLLSCTVPDAPETVTCIAMLQSLREKLVIVEEQMQEMSRTRDLLTRLLTNAGEDGKPATLGHHNISRSVLLS